MKLYFKGIEIEGNEEEIGALLNRITDPVTAEVGRLHTPGNTLALAKGVVKPRRHHRMARSVKFPNACKRWSPTDISILADGNKEAMSIRELAKVLGRTSYSVSDRLYILRQKGDIK